MCVEKSPWEKAIEFHGHACPGLAIGYKAAEAAMKVLGDARDTDEELVAVVQNDSCAVDAIQSVLGCTAGKGNLIFKNMGKQVYTVGRRSDGTAVRIALKYEILSGGTGTKEERMNNILNSDVNDLFEIRGIDVELPKKAVIFKTLKCDKCGEGVMESTARLKDGKPVCPECFEEYTRGW